MKEIYSFEENYDYDDDDREVQEILQQSSSSSPESNAEEYYAYYRPQYSSSSDSGGSNSDSLEDTQAILQSLQGGEQNFTYNERNYISNMSTPENSEQAAQIMQGLDENLSNFPEVYILLEYPALPMNEGGNCCLM